MRLVTRGDLDGLTCAVLITSNETVSDIALIHPQDITDGRFEVQKGDILANVPYHPNAGKWFDHHLQTDNNPKPPAEFEGAYGLAPSAARLVYDYYGGEARMPQFKELVHETDRLDSAQLDLTDVLQPEGFIKLGFTIDGRTGLGAFKDYFLFLNEELKSTPIELLLQHPEVTSRWERIRTDEERFTDSIKEHSWVEKNVVITDFRALDQVPVGNRFLVYALYPEVNVSLRLHWGPQKKFVVAAMGHSIFNRTCQTSIGDLAGKYGGGGHRGAGTAPLPQETADLQIQEIIDVLKQNG